MHLSKYLSKFHHLFVITSVGSFKSSEFASIDIDHCHDHPCKNGGFCLSEGDDFKCKCLDGYRGLLCEGK